jgi:hypothetical protein
MIEEIKKGSIWRKWDLHIHTPNSHLNSKYKCTYKEIAEKIIKEEIEVIGITNYFIVEENEITELKKFLPNETLVLANFEFRTNDKNKSGEYINSHVLFNLDKVSITQILESLSRIPLNNIADDNTQYCTIENIKKYGADNITISFDDLRKQLEQDFSILNDFLMVGVNNGYGGFHPDNKPRNIQLAKKMDKCSNLIFGRASDRNFFLNLEGPRKDIFKLPKPVFVCSDAHSLNTIGSEFTWVKADKTFEGLRQTIFEPQERTRIQENNPKYDYEKPYFSSINFKEDEQIFKDDSDLIFCKSTKTLPLNPNLVTIIGGRGEGKSMLSEYISSSFYGKTGNKIGEFNKTEKIEVEYSKTILNDDEKILFPLGENEHSVDFIYISQGDLKSKVESQDKKSLLADSISKLAKLEKPEFDNDLNKLILSSIKELQELQQFLKINENKIDYLKKEEKKTNEFISNITTEENKEKLEQYSSNLEKIKNNISKSTELKFLTKYLNDTVTSINEKINEVNGEINLIPLLTEEQSIFKNQLEVINNWLNNISKEVSDLTDKNTKIKESFNEVYKGDLSTLLKDVDKFQTVLLNIREKISKVTQKNKRFESLKKLIFISEEDKESLINKIRSQYSLQKTKLEQDWKNFTDFEKNDDLNDVQKEIMENLLQDLSVEVLIEFNETSFYEKIYHCINGAVWRVKNNLKAQKEYFEIDDIDSFYNFLENKFLEVCESNNGLDTERLTKLFFDSNEQKDYINVYPILKYDGKDLNKISVGQKGTVYLKLKLATEAFSKPIIFDQPEDDLDNEFIMNNLINLFKELKKYRQVIIVTHNANLVINADAEQVIVATNDKGKLKYLSGSLENELINKKICQILEGGELAFEKRRRKYKIQ